MHILQSSCERTQEDFFVLTLIFLGKFLEDIIFFHNFTPSLHAEGAIPLYYLFKVCVSGTGLWS